MNKKLERSQVERPSLVLRIHIPEHFPGEYVARQYILFVRILVKVASLAALYATTLLKEFWAVKIPTLGIWALSRQRMAVQCRLYKCGIILY